MLEIRKIKINVQQMNTNLFLLSAQNVEGNFLSPSFWSALLFNYHEESFYGTLFQEDKNIEPHCIPLNAWQLVTLFAKEQFNGFIEWDWDDEAQICLASSLPIYEAILEKEWIPDFSAWEKGEFRWSLPERVVQEFGPSFWEQKVEEKSVMEFTHELFHHALDSYFERNSKLKAELSQKMNTLRNSDLSPRDLAAYFDEESWQEWIGLKENDVPFTMGLKLEEPTDVSESWDLSIFLRGKKNPEVLVDLHDEVNYPRGWKKYENAIAKEQERWIHVFPWLKGEKGIAAHLSEDEAWTFLTDASETLLSLGIEILLPSWWLAMKNASLKVKARLKGSSSSHRPSFVGLQAMLDYDWRISMNGVDLSEDEFRSMVEEKRRLVYIRGRWIKLDPTFVRQIQDLMKKAEKEGLHVRDLIEQELLSDELEQEEDLENPKAFARIQIELNRQWKQMVKQLRDIKDIKLEEVPADFQGDLRPYQKLGMSWMLFLRRYGFGACLADDMGLGKTVQLISYLLKVREQEKNSGPALIICPTSVLSNWQKEIERFAPGLNVYLHYGGNRPKGDEFTEKATGSDIVLTSYGLSHLDLEEFERLEWSSISIDEAQNIKNAQTKQSKAVRKLKGKHHIALTGTPMENRLSELWSIFDFTNHGYLGSMGQFQKRFVLPIEKDDNEEKVKQLQAFIRPFLLRRTKKDEEVALNLPDKLEQKEYCPLTAEQASLYEQLVKDTFQQIENLSAFERKGLILQMLSRLKQLCNHPALYLKEEKPSKLLERSAKLEKLNELIESVLNQEESCLIFTQYIEMGNIIRQMIKKKYGVDVPFLNGSVPKNERDRMIEGFQNNEFPIFLLSLKAGGTGLNLTAANHVIHYDRWWNPAVENQATDRAYRIGQKRFVHVHKMICTGTLEEKIDAMLEKKQSLNDQIIQSESWITELSTEDLKDLVYLS
ncbi:DEAD/DEAH box helicase [Bacillus sp. S/N-304-OC-R1]|uniref:DEAD/DEAH box helicase n=1 Tax=Bacillus sp. S/N-304-OC-R1 TaxID=2758034 RepID=UPI001C8DA395|nr:DEAD/DEAH box helicase [Bacillus sp. S/N-304-OC-R1]MBY0122281.1 DEAD/DEAH box helicase [Bacillus sp. S/N-304-OC-R1]